jgi:hypothetical protein
MSALYSPARRDETEGPFLKVKFLDDSRLPRFRGR